MKKTRVILASRSPARRALARIVFGPGVRFTSVDIDERVLPHENPAAHVARLARAKALAVPVRKNDVSIVGVDTVIAVGGRIIGKPRDRTHARRILEKLSGRWHEVYSGVAVCFGKEGRVIVEVVKTRVKFDRLSRQRIDAYLATGEPIGCAGAYAIQGKGVSLVAEIRGSLTNVIGLPTETLLQMQR